MKTKAAALPFALAVAGLAGCGGALSDGGTGGGAGGSASGGTGGGVGGSASGGTGGGEGGTIPAALRVQLDSAIATWPAVKSGCATYSYDRRWYSVFGDASSTAVEVRDGVPTRRRYATVTSYQADAGAVWTLAWEETGSQVGQHPTQFSIYPASTVEQLQAECETILARDQADYDLRLMLEPHGVPTTCTYFPRNCVDDCGVGIRIESFTCAALPVDLGAN